MRSTDEPSARRKLTILCLHGYHGSADALRRQAAPLFAELASIADFVFVDAPSLAAGDYGWWHAVDAERDTADDPGVDGTHRHYKGWARTREAIVAVFASHGPFDGVFGFSQGAALAGLLVGLRAPDGNPTTERPLQFDFAIMVGGFRANDPELARVYEHHDSYSSPSLHVFGRADRVVPLDDSRALAACFASPILVEHASGHVIASDRSLRERMRAFLEDRAHDHDRASPIDVPLWGTDRPSPSMRVVFPRRRDRAPALVVFRGGAYATNAGSGGGAAEWAAEHGMVGVEVAYRTRGQGSAFPDNYADAARAIRLVRARASAWGVDPHRVGVLGFSAGGHLASLLSTQPALRSDPADDLAPRIHARPDFVVLAYPVISFVEGYAPGAMLGTVGNFFGRGDIDEALRRQYSNELHVTADHPPTFVWTTADDALVPAIHAQRFAESCERARVPVSFTVFPHGPHGMGLALRDTSEVRTWTQRLLDWLAARGIHAAS